MTLIQQKSKLHVEIASHESADDMLTKAREMVDEANKLEGKRLSGTKPTKRKALDLDDDDIAHDPQPLKRTRHLEEQLKKERVKAKTLVGLSAALAIG